jgi:hypothetical protein
VFNQTNCEKLENLTGFEEKVEETFQQLKLLNPKLNGAL